MTKYSSTNCPPGFYTYAYVRKDGTPWYIGKGQGRRAWQKHGSDKCRWSPPKNDQILILKLDLQEHDAFKHEIYLIGIYGLERDGGILSANQTYGGQGSSGFQQPQELKDLQRNIQTKRQLERPDQHIVDAAKRWGFSLQEWQAFTMAQRRIIMAALRRGVDRAVVMLGISLDIDLRTVQTGLEIEVPDLVAWASLTQRQRDSTLRRCRQYGFSAEYALSKLA